MNTTLIGRSTLTSLLLTGLVSASVAAQTFTPRAQRLSDEVIARDEARFDSLMTAARGNPRREAYVSLAREAYERNDDGTLSALLLAAARDSVKADRTRAPQLWALADSARGERHVRAVMVDLESALIRAQYPLLGAPNCDVWATRAATIAQTLRQSLRSVPVVAVAPRPEPAPVVTPAPTPPAAAAPVPAMKEAPRELRGIPSMVHFGLNLHNLSTDSRRVLDVLVDSLHYFPDVRIVLEGHTDPRASAAYNDALSRRRSTSVQTYLLGKGIAASRIEIVAKGKSALQTEQTDVRSMAVNRRVQLRYFAPDGREIPAVQLLDDLQLETTRTRLRRR
jgi:outer membrane protein OmpA-like peptidoglycan-associated protein